MNRTLEQIALNVFATTEKVESKRILLNALQEHGSFQSIQMLEAELDEAVKEHNETNDVFWQAFKYPLEIFDLEKGEKPKVGLKNVAVYDETYRCWIGGIGLTATNKFTRGVDEVLDIERYHRWIILPELD